jgi:hypothetical protein
VDLLVNKVSLDLLDKLDLLEQLDLLVNKVSLDLLDKLDLLDLLEQLDLLENKVSLDLLDLQANKERPGSEELCLITVNFIGPET